MNSPMLNATHDPSLRSWVNQANQPGCDFPIQNLPYGVFRRPGEAWRVGVGIGDQVLDLHLAGQGTLATGLAAEALTHCAGATLNPLMALGVAHWTALRATLSSWLATGSPVEPAVREWLVPMASVELGMPASIGDYTDFYTSIHHATNVGKLFRPENPLLPNYRWVPVGYHGRSSSIDVSGHSFPRPQGQVKSADAVAPTVSPSQRVDFELEVGVFVGQGNAQGVPIPIQAAEQHVFGLCLLNDWSARDIQAWEYQPLGPFLAKNFASTISPWVVTLEALAPYRRPWHRAAEDPQPLDYLDAPEIRERGAIDMALEVLIETASMRHQGLPPERLAVSNFQHSYWAIGQLLAHHSMSGCNLRPGDLLGSGTQSGPLPEQAGALIELTDGGRNPITLSHGEARRFLEDGDRIILKGWCDGDVRIGFGEASATLLPAVLA